MKMRFEEDAKRQWMKRCRRAVTTLALGICAATMSLPAHAAIVWQEGFEDNYFLDTMDHECGNGQGPPDCGVGISHFITTWAPRSGSYTGVSRLRKVHERAEYREKSANHPAIGEDRWYGFSLKPESNFDTTRWTIVHQLAQWYSGVPDWANTGAWHALTIENGTWWYRIKYSDGSPQNVKTITYNLGTVQKGAWTDFVINGVWRSDQYGKFQVWIRQPGGNYVKKGYREGSVILNVPKAPYFKIGQYRGDPNWSGVNNMDTLYVDAIKVARNSWFNEVAP
jgi:hypothetical protein